MDRNNHMKQQVDYQHATEWLECTSKSGKKYYYNSRTTESTWEVPPEFLHKKYKDKSRLSLSSESHHEHASKKYKGEGLLLTPTSKSNGTNHHSTPTHTKPGYQVTPGNHVTPSSQARTTPVSSRRHLSEHTPRSRAVESTPSRPSTSRRLNHLSIRSKQDEYSSIHEGIPSPVIREHKTLSNSSSSRNSSPALRTSDHTPSRLSKLLSSSMESNSEESELKKQEFIRTKFLDPQSITLLTNQSAEILERQSKQLHEDARRLLDVDLLRTITDCANLRAVQNVHSLRSMNIEHKLYLLQNHIKWLEDGSDFT